MGKIFDGMSNSCSAKVGFGYVAEDTAAKSGGTKGIPEVSDRFNEEDFETVYCSPPIKGMPPLLDPK